jgi:predicted nucleic acid-binding protein
MLRRTSHDAVSEIMALTASFEVAETSKTEFFEALELACTHQFQIYDATVLATAATAGCNLLLTEDMHEGFSWNGVTIANPFKPNRHVWLDEQVGCG